MAHLGLLPIWYNIHLFDGITGSSTPYQSIDFTQLNVKTIITKTPVNCIQADLPELCWPAVTSRNVRQYTVHFILGHILSSTVMQKLSPSNENRVDFCVRLGRVRPAFLLCSKPEPDHHTSLSPPATDMPSESNFSPLSTSSGPRYLTRYRRHVRFPNPEK